MLDYKLSKDQINFFHTFGFILFKGLFLENIADWSLEESFNLYDEKEDLIYRFFNSSSTSPLYLK